MNTIIKSCMFPLLILVSGQLQIIAQCSTSTDTIRVENRIRLCANKVFQFGTQTISETGEYRAIYQTAAGCDSLVVLKVTTLPVAYGDTTFIEQEAGTSFLFHGTTYTESGFYQTSLSAVNGCDSLVFLQLTIDPPLTVEFNVVYTVENGAPNCATSEDGFIHFMVLNSTTDALQYSIDGGQTFSTTPFFDELAVGEYHLQVADDQGNRDTITTLFLDPLYTPFIDLGETILLPEGQRKTIAIQAQNITPITYEWTSDESLNCTDCAELLIAPRTAAYYYLTVVDDNGCTALDSVFVAVSTDPQLYIPTAFSPNNDGVNDVFQLLGDTQQLQQIQELRIFDRWGSQVFQTTQSGGEVRSWDGRVQGQLVPIGIYMYQIVQITRKGFIENVGGDVMVIY